MVVADRNKPFAGGKAPLKPAIKTTLEPTVGGSSAPQNAAASNPWSSGRTNALKSALASARNPSQAPRQKSVMMAVPATPSDVAARMNNLTIKSPGAQSWRATGIYNPSVGPTPSTMTTKWRQTNAPSRATDHSRRQAFTNAVCKISNYTRRDFKLGDVIAAPFHVANTNPNVNPEDQRLTRTCEGHAYSKRRMMVVLFVHHYDLFCLPLFSFSGRGLTEKPDHIKHEYVCMKNVGARNFVNHGVHQPVEIQAHHPVTDSTTVHLTGGLRVGCNEDITRVGRLTEKSYFKLVETWEKVVEEAQNQSW
jgi:hypothetical protein